MKDMIKSPVTTKVQPSPERLAVQMKFMERRYDDVLTKVLEQNALILNSVARMQDDLKDLRAKMESLELSIQEEPAAATANGAKAANGVQNRFGESAQQQQQQQTAGNTGLGGQAMPPASASPFAQQPPMPFYNPYMYNPYMMMPLADLNYMVNPATSMQYAAMYGALNQSAAAAAALSEPSKTIPPFSFGVTLPSAATPVDSITSSGGISFAPPKSAEGKKIENGGVAGGLAPAGLETAPAPSAVTPTKPAPKIVTVPTPPQKTAPVTATTTPKPAAPVSSASSVSVGAPGGVFSVTAPPASSAPSIFGTPTFGTPSSKGSILGTPSSTTATFGTNSGSGSLSFGTPSSANATFGTPSAATPIFGTPASSNTSIFAPATTATPTPKPTFTFGMTTTQDKVDGPVFSLTPKPAPAPAPKESIAEPKKDDKPATGAPVIDFSELAAKANMCSFGDVAAKTTTKPVENPFGSFKGFGTGTTISPVFGSVSSSAATAKTPSSPSAAGGSEEHEEVDDFVPTAEFAPVIPLPPLVEVKKGDENENVLYQHRAKLLRFVKETKEWKERGIGDIKILQAKDNSKKIRVVMWREKVHKIACNHWVTKEINVVNYQGNKKALMWTAIDFAEAEEGPKTEIFVARFGQEDAAEQFKKQMEYAVSLVDKTPVTPQKGEAPKKKEEKKEEKKETATSNVPLSQLFKKPEGTWSCQACYTDNKKESTSCAACTTPNPNAPQPAKSEAPAAAPKFTFGFGLPSAPAATPSPVKTEEKLKETTTFTLKSSTAASAQPVFGSPATTTSTSGSIFGATTTPTSGSIFGTSASSSVFGATTSTPSTSIFGGATTTTVGSVFGDSGKDVKKDTSSPAPFLDFSKLSSNMPSFGNLAAGSTGAAKPFSGNASFGAGTIKPVFGAPAAAADSGPKSPTKDAEEGDEDEFVPTAEFRPVIPLPPLVEVKKGDENENVLFQHRAKLLRFVPETKEWKERGVGEIKLLQNKENLKKIRVVMWREQVHKIACNHWVAKDMDIKNYQGNKKALMWTALDFADAEKGPSTEIFVCKFGQEDKAEEFRVAFDKAIQIVKNAPDTPEKPKDEAKTHEPATLKPLSELFKKPEGDWNCDTCYCHNSKDRTSCISCSAARPGAVTDSVSSTGESNDRSDLIQKAEKLLLPPNYFTDQKDKPDHPPCRGCDPDSFDFSLLDGRKVPSFEDIPKPQREQSPKQPEILKDLLSKSADSKVPSSSSEPPKSALSSFSFSLPSSTTITPASSATSEFKINTPTFSFTPNFNLTSDKTSVIGSSSIFGSGSAAADSTVPTTVASYGEHEEEHGEEEEEDEEDEDPMFLSDGHAWLKEESGDYQDYGDGHVKILYDGDHFCARFWFVSNNDEDMYIDHIIAAETHVKPAGPNTFEWGCIYFNGENSVRAIVKVQFPDQQTYDQFSTAMADSVDIAMQAGVTEDDLVNGSGGDSQD